MLPDFKDQFRTDLTNNFRRLSNNFTKNIFIADIEKEGIMYACSMCIEFEKKAGFTRQSIIMELATQCADVLIELFDEYNETHKLFCITSVLSNMELPNISSIVDNYYLSY